MADWAGEQPNPKGRMLQTHSGGSSVGSAGLIESRLGGGRYYAGGTQDLAWHGLGVERVEGTGGSYRWSGRWEKNARQSGVLRKALEIQYIRDTKPAAYSSDLADLEKLAQEEADKARRIAMSDPSSPPCHHS